MNITDHLVRVQQQGDPKTQRVFGMLYGKQKGMSLEVATSFEMLYTPREDGEGIVVDKAYLENNIKLSESPRSALSTHSPNQDRAESSSWRARNWVGDGLACERSRAAAPIVLQRPYRALWCKPKLATSQ